MLDPPKNRAHAVGRIALHEFEYKIEHLVHSQKTDAVFMILGFSRSVKNGIHSSTANILQEMRVHSFHLGQIPFSDNPT